MRTEDPIRQSAAFVDKSIGAFWFHIEGDLYLILPVTERDAIVLIGVTDHLYELAHGEELPRSARL
jgi:hypothetical protein